MVSPTTVALLESGRVELKHLGEHRLKDLTAPIPLHQLQLEGLPGEFPPLKTLYRSQLPVPATPFLGREHELQMVVEQLVNPDTRLLTLTGPGGTGKTRLAIQAAAEAAEHFPDGTWWVSLSPLRDPSLVMPAIADALDVREEPGEPLTNTVAKTLLGKKALLLADNAEHLLPQAAHDLAGVSARCPTLKLLVTSRERLQLTGEIAWPVPILSGPDGIELFVQRAKAVTTALEPTDDVAAICEALDHLPLAIELAAARTRSLSPHAILERLASRLTLLTSRAHDVDERQRTLEATIAWSYDLLDLEEQRAVRALSVFAGGCTLEAAQQVAGADLDLLESLLDKSLLRHRADDGRDRYWMLETIREYAGDRLEESGETNPVVAAFLAWLDRLVGEVDEPWIDRDQLEWFHSLERERANLMHGIATAIVRGSPERALRLIAAANQYIDARGPYAPVADMLTGLHGGGAALDGRGILLRLVLLMRMGRDEEVTAGADAALAAFAADPLLQGRLQSVRSWNSVNQDDPRAGLALARSAVELARAAGDHFGLALALNSLGLAEMTLGEIDLGMDHLLESNRVSMELGDLRNAAIAKTNLALALLADKKPDRACVLLRDVLQTVRRIGDPFLLTLQLGNLAIALTAAGDTTAARDSLREALAIDFVQFDESLRVEGLVVLALAAEHDGDPEQAIALWAAGSRLRTSTGYVIGPELAVYVTARLEPLRAVSDFERHWESGLALSVDDALELGLRKREGGHEPSLSDG